MSEDAFVELSSSSIKLNPIVRKQVPEDPFTHAFLFAKGNNGIEKIGMEPAQSDELGDAHRIMGDKIICPDLLEEVNAPLDSAKYPAEWDNGKEMLIIDLSNPSPKDKNCREIVSAIADKYGIDGASNQRYLSLRQFNELLGADTDMEAIEILRDTIGDSHIDVQMMVNVDADGYRKLYLQKEMEELPK